MKPTPYTRALIGDALRKGGVVLAVLLMMGLGFGREEELQARSSGAFVSPSLTESAGQQPLPLGDEATDLGEQALRTVEGFLKTVHTPDRAMLVAALEPAGASQGVAGHATLTALPDLDGDGSAEVVLEWTRLSAADSPAGTDTDSRSWVLLLLAWDGTRWRASKMLAGDEDYALAILPQRLSNALGVAVVLTERERQVPYPVIFRVEKHAAALAWDGRSDDSRYQGYAGGKVEFRKGGASGPEMAVTGKADPGVISFPPENPRGFEATALYRWEDGAFVPVKTEYTSNPDYTLYRFISALHLRDFRSAYALLDPRRFLKTDSPTLDLFRQQMEDSWPEFLDDQVFEARTGASGSADYAFELNSEDKHVLYLPHFSDDERHLLVGLEKRDLK